MTAPRRVFFQKNFSAQYRLAALVFAGLFAGKIAAQCPQVEAIMIDACGTEQLNEFLIINSGGGFNTADIQLDYDINNNIIGVNNNDINMDNNNVPPGTPCGITTGSTGAYTGCSNLIAVGSGVNIPANSIVILQASTGATAGLYNAAGLCGSGQCVYVVASSCARSAGGFTNGGGGGTRTTNFYIAGGCQQTITYNLPSVTGGNGAYYLPLSDTYGNGGCVVPPSSPAPPPPVINAIPDITVCGDYTLPAITGTNLTPNAAYFTGMNGTGTQYNPGDVISSTTTLYAYDQIGPVGCSDEEPFTITISAAPTVNQPADVVVCAGQAVNVALSGSPGATFPWTNDNTATGLGASGTGNINFTSANVAIQQISIITITPTQASCTGTPVTFSITVNPRPTVDDPPNMTVCGGDPISVVFTGNSGTATYNWTNTNTNIGLPASGSGDLNFNAANVASNQTGTITVTATENGCAGTPQNFTITVQPLPTVNPPANVTVCGGAPVSVSFSGTPAGTAFSWTNDNTAIGLGASGTGNISFTSANVANQEVATIIVVPTLGACAGAAQIFTITVNPGPTVDDPPNLVVCSGDPVDVVFTGTGNPTFNWTNSNTTIGLGASGNGDISFTASPLVTPQTGTITVTPNLPGCPGLSQTFTITVNPLPTMSQPANVTVCGGLPVAVNFSGTGGSTFSWTNDNTNIGLGASGTGNLNFTTPVVGATEVATITVTPTLNGCEGTPRTFTITVNPGPTVNNPGDQTYCGGQPVAIIFTGTGGPTYTWTNTNPAIGLPGSGSGSINFTTANVAAQQTGTITVTPSAGGCSGTPEVFTITVTPAPNVNQPPNLTLCSGQGVVLNFSGTGGATFDWTNSNPNIGLPASGSGNLNFTAGTVATQQTGTITVTPSLGSCDGLPISFTITVNPAPAMNDPIDLDVCPNFIVNVNFSGAPPGTTFAWTNNNTATGLAASGNGNITFTAANVPTTQTGTITVTPTLNGCAGAPQTFNITVEALPTVTDPGDQNVCAGQPVNIAFSGSAGATYAWTNSNPAIGLGASGSGNIIFTAANVAGQQTGTITVTPSAGGCAGTPQSFAITVSPAPAVNQPANATVCGGQPVAVNFSGSPGATFSWTNSNTAIGLPASGSGNLNFTSALVTTPQTGTITVTPTLAGCAGPPVNFTILVDPTPVVTPVADLSACGGQPVAINLTGTGNPTFNWTNSNTAIGLGASGAGNINFTAATVAATETGTIIVTPVAGLCTGTPDTFTISVVTAPVANDPADATVCGGQPVAVNFTGSAGTTYSWANSNTAIGLPVAGFGNLNFTAANVATPQTATVTVTPTLGACSGAAVDFTITVNPAVTAAIAGNQTICNGQSTTLTASGGAAFLWDGGQNTAAITVSPATTTTYTVIVSNAGTCADTVSAAVTVNQPDAVTLQLSSCNPADTGTAVVTLANQFGCDSVVTTVTSLLPSDTTNLTGATCDPNGAGTFTQNLTNQFGCDSLIVTTITFDPANIDTTALALTTCDPNQAGTTQTSFTGSDGCDSLVITTVTLFPSDTTNLTGATCDPNGAGTFTQILQNQFGCDSTVVTTITFDPANIDTTALALTTCDPNQAGTTQTLFTGSDGCDSLVITTVTLLPSDTTNLTGATCDPNGAGTFTQNLTNQFGCDSTIVTVITFDPANIDTTLLAQTTCDPSQAGTNIGFFTGSDGCDSLVITTTTLLPSNTVNLTGTTCDPNGAGTFTQNLTNQFGCDSTVVTVITFDPANIDTTLEISSTCDPGQAGTTEALFTGSDGCDSLVITTTLLLPTDTTDIFQTTCDPGQAGEFPVLLQNQFGCDSLVVTVVDLLPGNLTELTDVTCDPNGAGTFTQNLQNQFGCDSVVVTTVVYDPAGIDSTFLNATTCDPGQVGFTSETFAGADGCDSVVVTYTLYDPILCDVAAFVTTDSTSCSGLSDGSAVIVATGGQPPFDYTWTDGAGNTGSGQIAGLNTPTLVTDLAAGFFSVTITGAGGAPQVVVTSEVFAAQAMNVLAEAVLIYNSFAISCNGAADGSAQVSAQGGTPPYQFVWSNGATNNTVFGLGVGAYTVTATDANGCKVVATVQLTEPLPLQLFPEVAPAVCGDTVVEVTLVASGGAGGLELTIDGQPVAGLTAALGAGTHLVEATDANGCTADTTLTLTVPPVPQLFLPTDTTIRLGESLTVTATTNLTVWQSLIWDPVPDTSCAGCLQQTWMPGSSQNYTLTLVDTFGCPVQATLRVTVREEVDIYVPNVFSPDDDGLHDLWQIDGGPTVTDVEELRIFDRWGDQVYGWDDPIPADGWPGWDGRVGGKPVEVGVYVYYLKVRLVNGAEFVKKGDLTVVRR